MILILFLLLVDSLALPAAHTDTIPLPPPPVGGTKQDWLGYAITVGITALIGIVTRAIEKRRDRKKYEKNNPK